MTSGEQRRRRRKPRPVAAPEFEPSSEKGTVEESMDPEGQFGPGQGRRECPVPKPRGLLGQVLGFQNHDRNTSLPEDSKSSSPKSGTT